jgi:N-formylglutamate deformylase
MIQKIIHVPHSSEYIPNDYLNDYLIDNQALINEVKIMKDDFTYELVEAFPNVLKFPYSRIFCDVERFLDDREIMNKVGMGFAYTHSHDQKLIRKISNIIPILDIYNNHHILLNNKTKKILDNHQEVLILDIHSFSDKPLPYELYKDLKRPDICIGTDDFHSDKKNVDKLIYKIKEMEFSYSINEPFKGCIIPSEYYLKDNRVKGIMLEFNKKALTINYEKIKEFVKWTIENI